MGSTTIAWIIALCIMALAGLFGLIEALGDQRKWLSTSTDDNTAMADSGKAV